MVHFFLLRDEAVFNIFKNHEKKILLTITTDNNLTTDKAS